MNARSVFAVTSFLLSAFAACPTAFASSNASALDMVAPANTPITSKQFAGPKANTGTVSLSVTGGKYRLTLSDDFKTPDTPAPHWRLVDSNGNTYLLQRLKTKDKEDKGNRSIEVPDYIHDIAKVQVWCAWAEVVLGETAFDGVQTLMRDNTHSALTGPHTTSQFAGPKVNKGTVIHAVKDGKSLLTVSDDFTTPDTPAPHWRLVDSTGRIYLLHSLKTKGESDKANRSIAIPAYVPNVAKVQIYCAWAEVVLGEASFEHPIK